MLPLTIKTEEDFFLTCDFANKLFDFVKSISDENHWRFKAAYRDREGNYSVHFTSYKTHEYSKFLLAIRVDENDGNYDFQVIKQITELI